MTFDAIDLLNYLRRLINFISVDVRLYTPEAVSCPVVRGVSLLRWPIDRYLLPPPFLIIHVHLLTLIIDAGYRR